MTLTLKLGTTEMNYPPTTTDESGHFVVSVTGLVSGTWSWRVKGPQFLANSGTLTLAGAPVTEVEMGVMRTGDANNDNIDNITDFNIQKAVFAMACGQPGYDGRADFTEDCRINISDFNLLRADFGQSGAPQITP